MDENQVFIDEEVWHPLDRESRFDHGVEHHTVKQEEHWHVEEVFSFLPRDIHVGIA